MDFFLDHNGTSQCILIKCIYQTAQDAKERSNVDFTVLDVCNDFVRI